MKIACFGDSLTFGAVGYSYIGYIDKKYKVVNKGVNGDTTICTYRRLKKYIEKPSHGDVDVFVVAIGINDLLIPFLSTVSFLWKLIMVPRASIKKCINDDSIFESEYRKYIALILSHNKTAIAVGIPLLQIKGFANEKVLKRNRIIERLAGEYHIGFIDTAAMQKDAAENMSVSYSWKHKNIIRVLDALIMLIMPFSKDWFSKARRLELTVDGCHYNSLTAKLIGAAINGKLEHK